MEFAFVNGILRSPLFPPQDPWLSGYGISYYYFGYVMLAALVNLTGVDPAIAFNLGVALWYALVMIGAFGVVYDLVRLAGSWEREAGSRGLGAETDGSAATRNTEYAPRPRSTHHGQPGPRHPLWSARRAVRRFPGQPRRAGRARVSQEPGSAAMAPMAGHQTAHRQPAVRQPDRRLLVVVARVARDPRQGSVGEQHRGHRRVPVLQLPAGRHAPARPGAAVRDPGGGAGVEPVAGS